MKLTLPETDMAPKYGWLEYKPFLLDQADFQVRTVSFREGSCLRSTPRKINIEPENDGFGMFGR